MFQKKKIFNVSLCERIHTNMYINILYMKRSLMIAFNLGVSFLLPFLYSFFFVIVSHILECEEVSDNKIHEETKQKSPFFCRKMVEASLFSTLNHMHTYISSHSQWYVSLFIFHLNSFIVDFQMKNSSCIQANTLTHIWQYDTLDG